MKITDVKVHLAKCWRTLLFVEVTTDEGITGIGESGLTSRELSVVGAVDHLKPLLVGEDPFCIEHHWQRLFRCGFYPAGHALTAAISAIDIALWDIKGKALGVPVYQLLGGKVRSRVLTYTHIHAASTDELVDTARRAVADGWKCLRWEPWCSPDGVLDGKWAVRTGIEQWRALRSELGDDIELCYDMHTKLTPAEAARFCREIEAQRPLFIEDALRSENPASYRWLRQHTSVPLAAGEQASSKWDFRQLIEEELINYARIDLCVTGGITEAKKIAGWCETHYIDVAVHNPVGPVSTAASLHFNLATSNMLVQEQPKRPGECLSGAVEEDFSWRDGYLLPPETPGLGVRLDTEALKAYPFAMTELPHIRKPDDTFCNW